MLRRSVFRSSGVEGTEKTNSLAPERMQVFACSTPALSKKDAQTALLLSVIRATPNDVFISIAKDFLLDACYNVITSFKSLFSEQSNISKDEKTLSECFVCAHCQSRKKSILQSAEFLIVKAFIKLVIKLYLTLILDVTTVALTLLG